MHSIYWILRARDEWHHGIEPSMGKMSKENLAGQVQGGEAQWQGRNQYGTVWDGGCH